MLRRAFVSLAAGNLAGQHGGVMDVGIDGRRFLIGGVPAYRGSRAEGLLMNITWPDALSSQPAPDTLRSWREQGVRALIVTMQGFTSNGDPPDTVLNGLRRALDAAAQAGMAVILTIFSREGTQRWDSDSALRRAMRATAEFVLTRQLRHVLIELAAECGRLNADSPLLAPELIPALIRELKDVTYQRRRLLVTVSMGNSEAPPEPIARESDFILVRAAGIRSPARFGELAEKVRKMPGGSQKPLLFAADSPRDRKSFSERCAAALAASSSWGITTPLARAVTLSALKEMIEQ